MSLQNIFPGNIALETALRKKPITKEIFQIKPERWRVVLDLLIYFVFVLFLQI